MLANLTAERSDDGATITVIATCACGWTLTRSFPVDPTAAAGGAESAQVEAEFNAQHVCDVAPHPPGAA